MKEEKISKNVRQANIEVRKKEKNDQLKCKKEVINKYQRNRKQWRLKIHTC